MQQAVTLGLIRVNPVERIKGRLGRNDREVRKADYRVREDLPRLLATSERVCPQEHPIFMLMATAGLRIGETVALQVGDLDAPGLRLHVRRTLVKQGQVSSPKNGKARTVEVPPATMALLDRLRETRQAEAAYQPSRPDGSFPDGRGNAP